MNKAIMKWKIHQLKQLKKTMKACRSTKILNLNFSNL